MEQTPAMQNIAQALEAAQPPVVEERSFSGALFGFRRRDVLDYVRSMSEKSESYIRTMDDAVAALQGQLEASQQQARQLEGQVADMQAQLDASAQADTQKQQELEAMQAQLADCRQQLYRREQKYTLLQSEYGQLRGSNDKLNAQLRQVAAQLADTETRRADEGRQAAEKLAAVKNMADRQKLEMHQQHVNALAEARAKAQQTADERCRRLEQEADTQLEQLQQKGRQQLQEVAENARELLRQLGGKTSAEQERLAHSVEQVDAQLAGLKQEMEAVQQQIWAAHAMIQQTTRELSSLLAAARPVTGGGVSSLADGQPEMPAPVQEAAVPAGPAAAQDTVAPTQPAAPVQAMPTQAAPAAATDSQAQPAAPRRPQAGRTVRPQAAHSTVRGPRDTVADVLLDALGRLWDKK